MEETSSELLGGKSDCQACVHELVLLARQRVYIISQKLEPDLYNNREIYQHLTRIASNNRKADIRIIAHDTRMAANQGHYLINLAQKLSSYVQIRTTVTRAHRQFFESWLIIDDIAYMRIRNPAQFEGNFETSNKLETRSYITRFEEIWEACQVDQNTRRLSL